MGSIKNNAGVITSFSIGDETVINYNSENTSEVETIYNVVPDINNEIDFVVKEVSGSRWAIFNAVVIEAVKARTSNSAKKGKTAVPPPDAITVNYGLVAPEIGIYPNPNSGEFVLMGHFPKSGDIQIRLFNAVGKTIWEEKLLVGKGDFQKRIRIEEASGIYFLELSHSLGKTTQKVLVH